MDEKAPKVIDLQNAFNLLLTKRKKFFIMWPIVFILACVWILPEPRYYVSSVSLAPEISNDDKGGNLASLASSFGINIGGAANDAIYPMLYPDLFSSPEFIVSLFSIRVECDDEDFGHIDTDYYTYLTKYRKKNVLTEPFKQAKKSIVDALSSKPKESYAGDASKISAFRLSAPDYKLVEGIPELIHCDVDRKTDVTTISVQDQHPVVSAQLADSISLRLQNFITEYRTSKSRLDVNYYQQLTDSAKAEYKKSAAAYAAFCDSHVDITQSSFISQRDQMENEMGIKYETYTAMLTQLTAAKAKVQERTPAFTVLKSATVPIKPAGPKRMIFVGAMLFLFTFILGAYELRSVIFR